MGQVFLARTTDGAGYQLAAKLLRPELAEDPDLVSRFLQESRLLRRIEHPNVVRVLDLVAEKDRFGIVMEYVPDGDLRHCVPLPCPADVALELLAQVANGLAAIHAAGITHRDLKPENVLVQRLTGGALRARVTDFGVAHYSDSVSTRHNAMIGTAGYMSPEGAGGLRPGPEGDVYALGVMLYELCAGHRPFVGENPLAVVRAHANDAVPRPSGVPEPIWQLLTLLLAKDPAQRPAAAAARDRLRELAGPAWLPAAPEVQPAQVMVPAEVMVPARTSPGTPAPAETAPADTRPVDGDARSSQAASTVRTARRARLSRRAIVAAAIGALFVLLPLAAIVKPRTSPPTSGTSAATAARGPEAVRVSVPATSAPESATTTAPAGASTSTPATGPPASLATGTSASLAPGIPALTVRQPAAGLVEDYDRKVPLALDSVTPTAGTLSSIMILYQGGARQIEPVYGFTGPYYATVEGLRNGRAYTFSARVCNSYGECSVSRPVTFTPYALPVLGALSASTAPARVTLTWPSLALNGNPRSWSCRLTADTAPHDSRAPDQRSVAVSGGSISWQPRPASIYSARQTCTDGANTVIGPNLTFITD
jgi:serine/threonine-protein kinase